MKSFSTLLHMFIIFRSVTAFGVSPRVGNTCTVTSKTSSALFAESESVRTPQLVAKVAEKTGMTLADSKTALSAVLDTIMEEVSAGNSVSLIGFGSFTLRERKARQGRNPKTGEEIQIAASKSPGFKPGKRFKDDCNK